MANSTLITTANTINLVANGANDTYFGTDKADAFVIADGQVGDDAIVGFSVNDTIITHKKIYDGNGDGYIDFGPGPNAVLDVDRTSSKFAGDDQISVTGTGGNRVTSIRYLGVKDGAKDFAYGAADVRDNFLGHFGKGSDSTNGYTGGDSTLGADVVRHDSQVSSELFEFGQGAHVLLIDNATGLNFGKDTINGFDSNDLLVTTSKLYDSNTSGIVTFGGNKVLDLSGANGPSSSDPKGGPGGQVDMNEPNRTQVTFLGEKMIGETTYYYYGTADHAPIDFGTGA